MINDKPDEVIVKLLESLFSSYQIGLETSMRDSDFIFDCVNMLSNKCHKMSSKKVDHI